MKKRVCMLMMAMVILMSMGMAFADYETPRPKTIVEPEIVVETLLEDHL